jgi:uncharacterized protein (TIGR02145 family)/uncharacterized repeat protein (TIGR02543 family)
VSVLQGSTGNKSYTANWTPIIYTITYTLNDETVTPNNPASYTIETVSFTLANPTRSCYTFTGWTGSNGTTAQTTVSVALGSIGNKNYTANWAINTYTLTTTANPSGGGTFSRSPDKTSYECGTNVLVTATANAGYVFTGWSGDASGMANPVTVTMNGNKTLTANFQPIVTVSSTGTGASGGGNYAVGATVSINAGTVPADYRFKNWTTASSGVTFANANSVATTFSMPANPVTVTANFEAVYFTDGRNSKKYRTVRIGTQMWMTENMNYQPASGNSWCYKNSVDSCTKYGRLYNWATAMNIDTSYNSKYLGGSNVKRQGVCPSGWHLPSHEEWNTLVKYAGGSSTAGTKLKSSNGWNMYSGIPVGTDELGFSALPGGDRYRTYDCDDCFYNIGYRGFWWDAYESIDSVAGCFTMNYNDEKATTGVTNKTAGLSVRCVMDE